MPCSKCLYFVKLYYNGSWDHSFTEKKSQKKAVASEACLLSSNNEQSDKFTLACDLNGVVFCYLPLSQTILVFLFMSVVTLQSSAAAGEFGHQQTFRQTLTEKNGTCL